jgi:hypothetical protein
MPDEAPAYRFLSAEQTGTGSAQSIPHTLGKTPESVMAMLTGGPASYTQPSIVLGTHTATDLIATVPLNWKYRLLAQG